MMPAALVLALERAPAAHDTGAAEPVTYTIDATLDERAHVVRAAARIEYRNVTALTPSRLYLHLFPNAFRDGRTAYARDHARLPWIANPLDWIPWGSSRGSITIHSVRVGGTETVFTVRETVMEVALASPLGQGESLTVNIVFEVKLPVLRLALGYRGRSYALALWYPKLAVPDPAGWHGDRAPTEAAFYADCGSYDVRITAPSDVVVAATGEPADSTGNGDGTTTRRWRARQVRYFAWVADRHYQVKHITWNGVGVEYLFLGHAGKSLEQGTETIRAALDAYTARYGPYPHRTLVIAETPALGGGIGGITYSQLIMLPASLRRASLPGLSYREVLAHEIAHQWWGMTVGVRDDRDDWLNEGLAELSAWRLERDRGPAYRRAEYVNQAALGFDTKIVQPGWAFGGMLDREVALYAKAPFVLQMLEYLVGRDTLGRVLRAYAVRYRHRTARTVDFIALADSIGGRDLTWFFHEWLDTTATCDYAIEAVSATPLADGNYRSVIRVKRNGGIVMPVEVQLTLEDGTARRRTWTGREPSHDIVLDSAPRVRGALLDPDRRLQETNRFNNRYPRRVRSSFLPRLTEDDAHRVVHLPVAFYEGGVELGLLIAGGRGLRAIPPTGIQGQHLAVAAAGYNLATETAVLALAYSNPLGLLGRRASWSTTLRRDGGREAATVGARAVFGPHLYMAPFHTFSISLAHERRRMAATAFDRGTVNSIELRYVLRNLITDFYPLHGGMLALEAEGAWRGLGSDWSFVRFAGRAEAYRRLLGGIKVALNAFAGTVAAGAAPRQEALFLSREGNFRAAQFDTVAGAHLTAVNGELRFPVGTGTLLEVAGFLNLARSWGSGSASGSLRQEVGLGLRLFDNANYGVQLDLPFWTFDGAGSGTFDFARFSLRIGRPFRGPGS